MGCGCGGSKKLGAKPPPKDSLRGPKAEGYYWNGPKRAAKTKRNPKPRSDAS